MGLARGGDTRGRVGRRAEGETGWSTTRHTASGRVSRRWRIHAWSGPSGTRWRGRTLPGTHSWLPRAEKKAGNRRPAAIVIDRPRDNLKGRIGFAQPFLVRDRPLRHALVTIPSFKAGTQAGHEHEGPSAGRGDVSSRFLEPAAARRLQGRSLGQRAQPALCPHHPRRSARRTLPLVHAARG